MRPLSPRERKLVAVAILLALIAGAWGLVVEPLLGGFSARAEARRELLDRYRRNQDLLAAVPVLRAQAMAERRTAGRFHVVASSPAAGADALRQRISAALAEGGGQAGTIETIQGGLPPGWVGVRADAALTLTRFVAAVRRLENEEPYVVVDYASLRTDAPATAIGAGPLAGAGAGTGAAPTLGTGGGPLQVRLQVSAPVRAPAAR